MDSLAEQLLEKIRGDRSPRRRLFVDGNEGFRAAAIYHDRMPRFLSALTNELRTYDVSTIISEELGLFKTEIDIPSPELVNVAETVILLRYIEHQSKVKRLLSILKMRESKYDSTIRELTLTDDGPMVGSPFVQTEGVLTGLGRTTSTQSFARSKAPASKGRGSGKPTGRAKGRGR